MIDMISVVARAIAKERWSRAREVFDGKSETSLVYSERLAKAAIKAHESALKAEGLVIVPREPTDEMRRAGARASVRVRHTRDYLRRAKETWQAMLAAEGKDD